MPARRRAGARAAENALASLAPEAIDEIAWRVAWEDQAVTAGTGRGGRWTPPGIPVLYCSLHPDGTRSEVAYRLSLEPVSRRLVRHRIYRIRVRTQRTARFPDIDALAVLGVNVARYKTRDYRVSQRIAGAIHAKGFDSLVAPSARADCLNLMVFRSPRDSVQLTIEHSEFVDWDEFLARFDISVWSARSGQRR